MEMIERRKNQKKNPHIYICKKYIILEQIEYAKKLKLRVCVCCVSSELQIADYEALCKLQQYFIKIKRNLFIIFYNSFPLILKSHFK